MPGLFAHVASCASNCSRGPVRGFRRVATAAPLGAVAIAVAFATASCSSSASSHAGLSSAHTGSSIGPSVTASTSGPSSAPATRSVGPTTPVAPSRAGGIKQTVPPAVVTTRPAVPLTATAQFGNRVSARIVSVRSTTAQARGPGEVSGPAVALTIRLINSSSKNIALDDVVINVVDAAGTPGVPMSASPARLFTGGLAARGQADGVYVFALPQGHRTPVSVSVSYSAGAPIVLFRGNVK